MDSPAVAARRVEQRQREQDRREFQRRMRAVENEEKRKQERRRREREQEKRHEALAARRAAAEEVRGLDHETLTTIADDPATASNSVERRAWSAVTFRDGAGKSDMIEAASRELSRRQQARQADSQPSRGLWWVVGGAALLFVLLGGGGDEARERREEARIA